MKLGESSADVVVLDGDTKNSTYAGKFKAAFPERFIECYIAEQIMAGIAIGLTCHDRQISFASTYAAFWTRAFDQIRMGAISLSNANFCGSHVGCSIGKDGAPQMAVEDIAMFRTISGSTVFYPCDAVSTERAVELAANTKGICYIRATRPATPVIYENEQDFEIGKANLVTEVSDHDICTVVGGGITVHEALKAAKNLTNMRKSIRVIDVFTVKPLDWRTILDNAEKTQNRIIVVEDHHPQGEFD